jgi:hypothetical protein
VEIFRGHSKNSRRIPVTAKNGGGYRSAWFLPRSHAVATLTHTQRGIEPDMSFDHCRVARWLELIQAEYREMPGLMLNKAQMRRLWGLDAVVCDALVDALVAARVLRRTAKGTYARHD